MRLIFYLYLLRLPERQIFDKFLNGGSQIFSVFHCEPDLPFEKAFGPLVLDPESAVEEIKKAAENGFEPEKIYAERMRNFYYPLENCAEALYNEVSSWDCL